MGRIANKKTGKLNKQYRDPSVFYAPKRRRKSYRYTKKRTCKRSIPKTPTTYYAKQNTPKKPSPLYWVILFMLLLMLIMLLTFGPSNTNDSESSTSAPTVLSSSMEETEAIEEIDLSAFSGDCGITVAVDITKESDSHLLDTYTYVTNTSGKNISEVILYFVKCYDDSTPIDSWQNTERLKIDEISNGDTRTSRYMLGTTTEGAREYKIFVGYVLFDDGTEWGTNALSHLAVVTRGIEAEVSFTEIQN